MHDKAFLDRLEETIMVSSFFVYICFPQIIGTLSNI